MSVVRKKYICPSTNSDHGNILKTMLAVLFESVPQITNVTVSKDTNSEYDVSFDYDGFTVRIFNSGYRTTLNVNGGECNTDLIGDLDYFKNQSKTYLYVLFDENSRAMAVFFQAADDDRGNIKFALVPGVARMSDGSERNAMFAYGRREAGSSELGLWVPSFPPATTVDSYVVALQGSNGTHSVSSACSVGTAYKNTNGKAVAAPLSLTSTVGEITEFTVGGFPLYRIYLGQNDIKTDKINLSGAITVKIAGAKFMMFTKEDFIRLS